MGPAQPEIVLHKACEPQLTLIQINIRKCRLWVFLKACKRYEFWEKVKFTIVFNACLSGWEDIDLKALH